MKHAVIVAHPNPSSFTAAVARVYADTARELGAEAIVRDLYALDFDPRLKAGEIPAPDGTFRLGADVEAERAAIGSAEVFAFVYPWWFNAPPAILKGYVDRVFGIGFGYRRDFGGTEPALTGHRLISISSSGAPEGWVRDTRALTTLMAGFDQHLANVTGLTLVDHIHLGGVVPGITYEAAEELFEQVRQGVRRCFGSA